MWQKRKAERKQNNRGFTMVELMVTLTIMGILLAITFVGLRAWMRNSEFKKCNEYAHTLYTSASLELSALDLASDLDRFDDQVVQNGTPLSGESVVGVSAGAVFTPGRMYAITAKAGDYQKYLKGETLDQPQAELVYQLIDNYSYDKEVCNYAITIEYDSQTRSVYAVYVSTKADEFVYSNDYAGDYKKYDEKGTVSLNAAGDFEKDRSSEVRKSLMIGYYCVEELGINAAFDDGKLRTTSCYLDNEETLDLVVASNSKHAESDVKYTATIYKKGTGSGTDQKLFDVTFSWLGLQCASVTGSYDLAQPHVLKCQVSEYSGENKGAPQDLYFPLSYQNDELRLTLDGAMSARTINGLSSSSAEKQFSTSFHRFLTDAASEIYASVRVEQLTAQDLDAFPSVYDQSVRLWIEGEEYIAGAAAVSNVENAFYASVKNDQVDIAYVRHLANIRYYDTDKTTTFQLTRDLQFDDAVIYDQDTTKAGTENAMEQMENHTTKAFPSISMMPSNWTLTGEKALSTQNYSINGLVLTEESVLASATTYGIVQTNQGTIRSLNLNASQAVLGYDLVAGSDEYRLAVDADAENARAANSVKAAGVLCGLNQGTITGITMDDATLAHLALNYEKLGWSQPDVTRFSGIGLVCGVHDGQTTLSDIRTAGELQGHIYDLQQEDSVSWETDDAKKRYCVAGIGGVSGIVFARNNRTQAAIGEKADEQQSSLTQSESASVKNTARITGNTMLGGIAGNIRLENTNSDPQSALLVNCVNEGIIHLEGNRFDLVACSDDNEAYMKKTNHADNCFAGGIIGYLQRGKIEDCTSAAGVDDADFQTRARDAVVAENAPVLTGGIKATNAHQYLTQFLTGNYVGGIAGCIEEGQLENCSTLENGYVLGNDEVGGIVGYLAGNAYSGKNYLNANSKELENGCYVIGHSDVGGIVGSNRDGSVLENCVNEGVVVGGGRNIGGVAGKNIGVSWNQARIVNCTSEVFDYDDSIFNLVSEVWQIYGDNVGGLVGFNEYGSISRTDNSDGTKTNIAAIVVGNNNVGGVFGLAGEKTNFDFEHYTIDGGEVYARFDNAGGYIGANLCREALPSENYEIKPYSVHGRYAVGGAIGANVLLQKDYEEQSVSIRFSNTNTFGTVYGANAVGGIIGYQRNVAASGSVYTKLYPVIIDGLATDGMNGTFVTVKGNPATTIDGQRTVWFADRDSYNGKSKDYALKASKKQLIVTGDNASTVIAGSYGGGILGYGCAYDPILVKGCTNSGDVSDWQAHGVTGSRLIEGSIAVRDLYTQNLCENGKDKVLDAVYSYTDMKQALASGMTTSEPIASFVGGIQGFVSENTTIQDCTQTGMIYAQNGFGGIAGINLGILTGCRVQTSLGTKQSDLVGGITAINGKTAKVIRCEVGEKDNDYTIEGNNLVGGLFALNLSSDTGNGTDDISHMYDNVSGSNEGYAVGGLCGVQAGELLLGETIGTDKSALQISGGTAVGGVAGVMLGQLQVIQTEINKNQPVRMTGENVEVSGKGTVGGVVGILNTDKKFVVKHSATNTQLAYENAAPVSATQGCAAGIVARMEKGIVRQATNVTSAAVQSYGTNDGYAGGIVAFVSTGGIIESSTNYADITAINNCAGSITAWNQGTLKNCVNQAAKINSNDESMGIITARNDGTITGCHVERKVKLQGSGSVIGGITGINTGTIKNCAVKKTYTLETSSENPLTIGGAIGKNEWTKDGHEVAAVTVSNLNVHLEGSCAYFGGLIGVSSGAGTIADCSVNTLKLTEETTSLKNSCYGGAIGSNASTVENITVKNILADVNGLYQANITLAAEEQENLASCFGGIVGKNQTDGTLDACILDTSSGYDKNQIVAANGFVGGIVGMNQGHVQMSGYEKTDEIMSSVRAAVEKEDAYLQAKAGYTQLEKNIKNIIASRYTDAIPDLNTKKWTDADNNMEKWARETLTGDRELQMLLRLTENGSIGGISACNTSTGTVTYCMNGQWLIDNRSASQYSAQGGIIGTNESDEDICFLVNQAMVLRESQNGVTERVNGGIIGNQHNLTSDQWSVYGCINTGMVVNNLSHYSGGIIGRWSDQGGTIEYCRNYGMIQTSYNLGWRGATGGIVAQLNHPVDDQSYTILSCRNDGKIWGTGKDGRDINNCANESGGIVGNVISYQAPNNSQTYAQPVQLNIIDCVNGPDATIICNSMAGGIIGYMTSDRASGDTVSLARLELNIDRCRNYSTDFLTRSDRGFAGIFGDRNAGHELTRITNCFTVYDENKALTKKGYICHDGGSANGNSYKYDGGKSAISYNNRVLLVKGDAVDASVEQTLNASGRAFESGQSAVCYPILQQSNAKQTGLASILDTDHSNGSYTVSGTRHGAQLYIQLPKPMQLDELSLTFDDGRKNHSYRVEYLVEDPQADRSTSSDHSLSGSFILAKEKIRAAGETETVDFPQGTTVYALRIQYVQNGLAKSTGSDFQRYGYYFGASNTDTSFTLSDLKLTYKDGGSIRELPLSEGTAMTSPRLVERDQTGDHLRNASTQYLYVASAGGKQYLIEPQLEDKQLSVAQNRTGYYQNKSLELAGNQVFYAQGETKLPYGTIFATLPDHTKLDFASDKKQATCEILDQVIVDSYQTSLAAAMPFAGDAGKGKPRPQTPTEVTVNANQSTLDIEWKNSIDGARNTALYYLLTVKDTNGNEYISEKKCFGNEWHIAITEDMAGKRIVAQVKAVNENGSSGWRKSEETGQIAEPMLKPQIRLELTGHSGNNMQYQITLANRKAYEAAYGSNWSVVVSRQGGASIGTLNSTTQSLTVNGYTPTRIDGKSTDYTPSEGIWLLYAQAKSTDNSHQPSEKLVTSVYTPNDNSDAQSFPEISQLYAAFDSNYESELDAKLNVYLTCKKAKTGIYPIYQVDLIRVDSQGTDQILASKELAGSDQVSSVTFTELPETFFDKNETQSFYVRAWISQTGVGPVYTWHEATETDSQYFSLLVNTSAEDQSYVTSLADKTDIKLKTTTTNGTYASLDGKTDQTKKAAYRQTDKYARSFIKEGSLRAKPSYEKDHLYYTFNWGEEGKPTADHYRIQIYGKSGDARILLRDRTVNENSLKQNVDDWPFADLEVVVTPVDTGYAPADASDVTAHADRGQMVPLVLRQNLTIRTRLTKLSQPSVKLLSQNDLKYQISWQDVSANVNESVQYALYVNGGDEPLVKNITATSINCDLEKYGGKQIDLYVVAYTDEKDLNNDLTSKSAYFKSQTGLKKRLAVGSRKSKPELISDTDSWSYRDYTINVDQDVLTEAQYLSNTLKLNLGLSKDGNYIMNAVLFETKKQAEDFVSKVRTAEKKDAYGNYQELEKILAGESDYQCLSANGKPVMMTQKEKGLYNISPAFRNIFYAGGYIVPLVRVTESTKISSYWTCGEPYRIPKVKLNTPDLTQIETTKTYDTFGQSFRNRLTEKGTPFTDVTVRYESYQFTVPSYVKEDKLTLTTGDGNIYQLTVSGDRVVVHATTDVDETYADSKTAVNGGFDYTYTLSGSEERLLDVIRNPVEGSYRSGKTARAVYRMTFDTSLRREVTDAGTVYTLRLPQTKRSITCAGTISIVGSRRLITDVHIQAIPKDTDRYEQSDGKES